MAMETKLIEKLKKLGFSTYEAQVYLVLLKKYPSTGYEVSQMANIPQPRAYDSLKSLLKNYCILHCPGITMSWNIFKIS